MSSPTPPPAPRAGAHTPGPWAVIKNNHAAGELWLSIGHEVPGGLIYGPVIDIVNKRTIHLEVGELRFLAVPEEEQWANARLIAAAPAMLAMLEEHEFEDTELGEICIVCQRDPARLKTLEHEPDCWLSAALALAARSEAERA